jgi:RimJ/RimL family protein N-acetyltransferase
LIIKVVVGERNQSAQSLKNRYRENPQVEIHDSMPSLASLMANCDMAVGAGGVTALERLAATLPSIVFSLAPNQHPVCTQLDAAGLSHYAGSYSDFNPDKFVKVFDDFANSLSKHTLDLDLSEGIIDCLGARRIAEVVSPSSRNDLALRRAVKGDLLLYYGWVNDPLVRLQSITSDRVDLEDHKLWFLGRVNDPACRMLVFEVNSLPIGQVRFEQRGEDWEMSYSLDELFRGRGWGVSIIKMAVQWLLASEVSSCVIAKVKGSNTPSIQALLKSGFAYSEAESSNEIQTLCLKSSDVQSSC